MPNVLITPRSCEYSDEVWAEVRVKASGAVRKYVAHGIVPSERLASDDEAEEEAGDVDSTGRDVGVAGEKVDLILVESGALSSRCLDGPIPSGFCRSCDRLWPLIGKMHLLRRCVLIFRHDQMGALRRSEVPGKRGPDSYD